MFRSRHSASPCQRLAGRPTVHTAGNLRSHGRGVCSGRGIVDGDERSGEGLLGCRAAILVPMGPGDGQEMSDKEPDGSVRREVYGQFGTCLVYAVCWWTFALSFAFLVDRYGRLWVALGCAGIALAGCLLIWVFEARKPELPPVHQRERWYLVRAVRRRIESYSIAVRCSVLLGLFTLFCLWLIGGRP
jgi:hypothetical protein